MAALRITIYLEDKDRRALEVIRDRYGLATLSDAIRFSIRIVQGLNLPESALAHHLPVRGQRGTREPDNTEALIAHAQQSGHAAEHVIAHATAFLHRHHQRIRS